MRQPPSDKIVTCSPVCKRTRLQAQMTARNSASGLTLFDLVYDDEKEKAA